MLFERIVSPGSMEKFFRHFRAWSGDPLDKWLTDEGLIEKYHIRFVGFRVFWSEGPVDGERFKDWL